ncbi:acetate--CoA ligase family protein, partial [Escherichia coli]|nr:acetate--CoA ligase family protein [Escherichia coli]
LMAQGIAPLCGIAEAFDAAEAAAFIGKAWKTPLAQPVVSPEIRDTDEQAPDEAAAKALLAKHGLPMPLGWRCQTVDAAIAAAEDLTFPVALKALGVAHKSEHNAVRLNLRDTDAVRAAATDLIAIGSGLYVERMVTDAVAELIVGIVDDPQFGPLMT